MAAQILQNVNWITEKYIFSNNFTEESYLQTQKRKNLSIIIFKRLNVKFLTVAFLSFHSPSREGGKCFFFLFCWRFTQVGSHFSAPFTLVACQRALINVLTMEEAIENLPSKEYRPRRRLPSFTLPSPWPSTTHEFILQLQSVYSENLSKRTEYSDNSDKNSKYGSEI